MYSNHVAYSQNKTLFPIQALSVFHGLDVLAVDAKEGNREGAELRNKNLEKKWESLFRRADIR